MRKLFSTIIIVAIWYLTAKTVNSPYLPTPIATLEELVKSLYTKDFTGYTLAEHALNSLARVLAGVALAAATGIPLGIITAWVKPVEETVYPIIETAKSIPPIALIPFAIYFFRDPLNSIFIVYVAAFFPTTLNTIAGVKRVSSQWVEAALTMGAQNAQVIKKVVFPAALPNILVGLRIGLGVGWMSVIAAEMVGVKSGLGYYTWIMSETGLFAKVFAGITLITTIGLTMTQAIQQIEKRLCAWKQ